MDECNDNLLSDKESLKKENESLKEEMKKKDDLIAELNKKLKELKFNEKLDNEEEQKNYEINNNNLAISSKRREDPPPNPPTLQIYNEEIAERYERTAEKYVGHKDLDKINYLSQTELMDNLKHALISRGKDDKMYNDDGTQKGNISIILLCKKEGIITDDEKKTAINFVNLRNGITHYNKSCSKHLDDSVDLGAIQALIDKIVIIVNKVCDNYDI